MLTRTKKMRYQIIYKEYTIRRFIKVEQGQQDNVRTVLNAKREKFNLEL